MKTYLVPVDFSENSLRALEYAVDLASRAMAKIIVCHVYEVPASMPGFSDFVVKESKRENQQRMEEFLYHVNTAGVPVETVLREGSTVVEICDVTDEHNVSLVIMGTGGGKNIVKKLFGTTTEAVAKRAQCPVMAIPERAAIKPIEHIVYAADLENGDELTVSQLLHFKKIFNATLTFLHVHNAKQPAYRANNFIKENLQQQYPQAELAFVDIENKHVMEAISEYALANNTSLLAFTMQNKHFLEKIGHSSVSSRLLHHLKLPMLALPEDGILLDIESRDSNSSKLLV